MYCLALALAETRLISQTQHLIMYQRSNLPPRITKTPSKFHIGASKIEGRGVIASRDLKRGESVGEGIQFSKLLGLVKVPHITPHLGVWINHSYTPTASLQKRNVGTEQEAWHIVANQRLRRGDELTLDYNACPWYIQGALPHYV